MEFDYYEDAKRYVRERGGKIRKKKTRSSYGSYRYVVDDVGMGFKEVKKFRKELKKGW